MKTFRSVFIAFGLLVWLVGCGGGGGGSAGIIIATGSEITFEGWSVVSTPSTVNLAGTTQNASYTTSADPSFQDLGVSTNSTISIDLGADGSVERIDIQTPDFTLLWDISQRDMIIDTLEGAILQDSNGTFVGAFIQPMGPQFNWEYQTYGIWETGRGTGNGFVGGVSMGVPTTDSAIPTTGDVEFRGNTLGLYVDAAYNDYMTYGDLIVNVNFEDLGLGSEIDLQSVNTFKVPVDSLPSYAGEGVDPNLDFAGSLSYDSGTNTFSGDVFGIGWSGSSAGQFYGPNAEELGGVFSLSKGDGSYHAGSYGAAQVAP